MSGSIPVTGVGDGQPQGQYSKPKNQDRKSSGDEDPSQSPERQADQGPDQKWQDRMRLLHDQIEEVQRQVLDQQSSAREELARLQVTLENVMAAGGGSAKELAQKLKELDQSAHGDLSPETVIRLLREES